MSGESSVRYVIDAEDKITFVDESWYRFAAANDGLDLVGPEVIGRSLWDFIADTPTRHLYQQIVGHVRQGKSARFSLRCDSPGCRRLLEMTISAKPAGAVEFETHALRVEAREPMPLLARATVRTNELLHACAWCNRINVGTDCDDWVEVEEATNRLKLFELEQMPHLTHGICKACMASMMSNLATLETTATTKSGVAGAEGNATSQGVI